MVTFVTVQKGRPCVPFRIQGIYTVTTLARHNHPSVRTMNLGRFAVSLKGLDHRTRRVRYCLGTALHKLSPADHSRRLSPSSHSTPINSTCILESVQTRSVTRDAGSGDLSEGALSFRALGHRRIRVAIKPIAATLTASLLVRNNLPC
jgi:hypothetical protein